MLKPPALYRIQRVRCCRFWHRHRRDYRPAVIRVTDEPEINRRYDGWGDDGPELDLGRVRGLSDQH